VSAKGGAEEDAARARVRALAEEALAAGDPVAWFERLYREAGGDPSRIPWADLVADDRLLEWTSDPRALEGVSDAVVVGCGLGHDAEHVAERVPRVTAFDVSPAAVDWARRLHPRSKVRYEVGDLFALPAAWRGAFDLVVESNTLQALPLDARAPAFDAVASLVRPGGRVYLGFRIRPDDVVPDGPPWPLSRAEVAAAFRGWSWETPIAARADAADPSVVRAYGVLRAPARR
jgi:SAM-dependent methyltransferase